MWIYYIIFGIIFISTMGYFFLMIFFPELVGISGEDTKKAVKSHQEETSPKEGPAKENPNQLPKTKL